MMKILMIALCIFSASCAGQKKAGETMAPERNDTLQNPTLRAVPVCLQDLIKQFEAEKKQNPPRKIYSYQYKGKPVFYVPAICCDFYSDLYDDECKLIGHPDGGFTGRGDGKLPEFIKERKEEMLVWEDMRK